MPMFDRPPLKKRSKAHRVGTRIVVGVIIVGGILLLILTGPLAWCQTYGSPCG